MLPQQQAFLYMHLLGGDDTAISELRVVLDGPLDIEAFTGAWSDVVARHEALRTAFAWEGVSQPLQVVRRAVEDPLPVLDLSHRPDDEHEAAINAVLGAEPMDLRRAPVWRLVVARLSPDVTEIRWRSHHVLLDGWSSGIVVSDLLQAYQARRAGEPAPAGTALGPADFAPWLAKVDRRAMERHWTGALDGWPGPTDLPPSEQDQARPGGVAGLATRTLGGPTAGALRSAARTHQVSPAALLFAAWSLVLARQVDRDDITFGIVSSGRPAALPGAEGMVGTFARTLPLRVEVRPDRTIADWLTDLTARLAGAVEAEHMTLGEVRRCAGIAPDEDLFQSLVLYQNQPPAAGLGAGLHLRSIAIEQETPFPITIVGVPEGDDLALSLSYRSPIDPPTAECLLGQVSAALSWLATSDGRQQLHNMPLGPPDQLRVVARHSRGEISPPGEQDERLGSGERWAIVGPDDRPRPLGGAGRRVVVDLRTSEMTECKPLDVRRRPRQPVMRLSGDGRLGVWSKRMVQSAAGATVHLDEIEAVVGAIPGVAQAEAEVDLEAGDVVLVCWPAAGRSLSPELIWDQLLQLDIPGLPDRVVVAEAAESTREGADEETDLLVVTDIWEQLLELSPIEPDDDFFELGGDSLLGIQLLERLQSTFGVALDLDTVLAHPTPRGTTSALHHATSGADAMEPISFDDSAVWADAQLDPDLVERRPLTDHPDLDRIAMTGADSFLGAHLARELLRRPSACLTVLGPRSGPDAIAALAERWSAWGLWDDEFVDRLRPVRVRLSAPQLGLDDETWRHLATTTDCLFHFGGGREGAIAPYAAMSRLNVTSTRTLLALAVDHHPKALHVLSTLHSAKPRRGTIPEAAGTEPPTLVGPYTTTKWAVERLITEAAERGVFARAHRVGEVAFASSGCSDAESLLIRLLRASVEIGMAPRGSLPAVLSTADHAAAAVIAIAQLPRQGTPAVVNAVDPTAARAAPLRVADLLAAAGTSVEERTHLAWRTAITDHAAAGSAPVLPRQRARGLVHDRGRLRSAARDVALWGRHIGRRYEVDATSARRAAVGVDCAHEPEVLARVARSLSVREPVPGGPDTHE